MSYQTTMKPVYATVFILILLVATSATVAVTIDERLRRRDDGRWKRGIEYLNECSAAAHVQSVRYDSYADKAREDGRPATARLFSALAQSERVHERICAHASRLFNGEYEPPIVMVRVKTPTSANIEKSLSYERRRLDASAGMAARHAIEAGNRYVARLMIWLDGSNRRHVELLERARDGIIAGEGYEVCPNCGNMYERRNRDAYCPFCLTNSSEFTVFGNGDD